MAVKTNVAPWKKQEVARLAKMFAESPVVGIAEIGGIPAPQMQEMRASLRGSCELVGAKNRLVKLAIQEAAKSRPGLEGLADKVDGQVAVVATQMNPFKLYKNLKAGATMAPLKGGQVSPVDVTVKKGPTPFGPGPIVGEFQKAGIPAKIEGPKVVVTKDVTPVKAGDVVASDLALMLAKLDIKPVELAIRLEAAYEEGTIFLPDVLAIDEDAILGRLATAVRTAYELSLQTAWPTRLTAEPLVTRAYKIAAGAAIESGVDLGDAQEKAAEVYAIVLAGLGKKPEDLSDEVRERLGDKVELLKGVAAPAAAPAEAAEEPEEEEEEVSEEDAAAGLGSLFG